MLKKRASPEERERLVAFPSSLLSAWVDQCLINAKQTAHFYSGARKIIQCKTLKFPPLDNSLQLEHSGYTKHKMSHLRRGYLHEESRNVAVELWERRKKQGTYGSVGFTTYNHFLKSDPSKGSKRSSVMGPCIQSVVLTLGLKDTYTIDLFYRTTELFKKFPADLVFLRDELLQPFSFKGLSGGTINCHFANITIHPMYFVILIPSIKDPIKQMDLIEKVDPYFYKWLVKWTARYICKEHRRGIEKFAQAMRVHDDARDRITGKFRKDLETYLRKNHPGFRNDYEEDEDADE